MYAIDAGTQLHDPFTNGPNAPFDEVHYTWRKRVQVLAGTRFGRLIPCLLLLSKESKVKLPVVPLLAAQPEVVRPLLQKSLLVPPG